MKNLQELLISLDACRDGQHFAQGKTIEDVVKTCPRGDWLLWFSAKIDIDKKRIVLAKARCAKTVVHLMKDQRSINAVAVAELYGSGLISFGRLKSAADAAAAATAAAVDAAVDAAAYAAYAAAAVDAAVDAAAYDAYAAAAAADARKENRENTANICRELLGDLIIKKVNQLIK